MVRQRGIIALPLCHRSVTRWQKLEAIYTLWLRIKMVVGSCRLLKVCNEEQRRQILLMIIEEPGQLVRISLNSHGTRVVQKLIETLKTRQQISLVISALKPGFLALFNDLNGNHVVQRCLERFSNEDNKLRSIVEVHWSSSNLSIMTLSKR